MTKNKLRFPAFLSHWEISEYMQGIDLLVVGSGIVGLTTAIFFKRQNPTAKVTVVERGTLPSGASTKNAGFACFGSLSELLSDLESNSIDAVFELVSNRLDGLDELRKLVGDNQLSFNPCGGFELFSETDSALFEKCVEFLPEANSKINHLKSLKSTYSVVSDKIGQFGFNHTQHLIVNRHEGSINTGKMMRGLIDIARNLEIDILCGLEVTDWVEHENSVKVIINDSIEIAAGKLHVATNGFAKKLLPEADVNPARAQVLITEPIENLQVKGTFHLDAGFYYFRNVGDRILLGGGRNLDIDGETNSELEITNLIQSKLDELLSTVILPNHQVTIEHRWAGIMGVGSTKKPIIKRLSDRVTCSVRLGGMGVALGTSIGKQSAELIG